MGAYNSAVITTAGQSLLARAIADNLPFYFTSAKTTEYVVPTGTSAASLTELPNIKQSEEITSATVSGSTQVTTSVRFDNTEITLNYSINTIGVYARVGTDTEETLLAVITAITADVMPSYSAANPVSYVYSINLAISNASNINIVVSPTGTVNVAEFAASVAQIDQNTADISLVKSALNVLGENITTFSPNSKMGLSPLRQAVEQKSRYWYKTSGGVIGTAYSQAYNYICIPLSAIEYGILIHYNDIDSNYGNQSPVGFTASDQIGETVIDYLSVDNIKSGYQYMVTYDSLNGNCVLKKDKIIDYNSSIAYIWLNIYAASDYAEQVVFSSEESTNERITDVSNQQKQYAPTSKNALESIYNHGQRYVGKVAKKNSSNQIAFAINASWDCIVLSLSDFDSGLLAYYDSISTSFASDSPMLFTDGSEQGANVIDYLSLNNVVNGYHDITHYNSTTKQCYYKKEAIETFLPTVTHVWINIFKASDSIQNVVYFLDKSVIDQLDDLNDQVDELKNQVDNLPGFVVSSGNETYKRIYTWAGSDPITMIAQITDVHSAGTEKYKAVGYLNRLNTLYGFDLIGNFGDIGLDTSSETESNAWQLIENTKRLMDATTPWFFCKGNHDHGRVALLTDSQLDNMFEAPFVKQMHYQNETSGKCYGYVDLSLNKIRVINVNTSEEKQNGGYKITAAQLNWVAQVLASVQQGWNVVIVSHMCVDPCGRWNSYQTDASGDDFVAFRGMLESFVAKTSGSHTVGGTTISWDFTGVNSGCKLICSFAGDSHFNNTAVTNGVRYIVRQGYGGISTSEMPQGATRDDFNYQTQCLFDVLCIKNNGNACVFRIGAGGSARDLAFTY